MHRGSLTFKRYLKPIKVAKNQLELETFRKWISSSLPSGEVNSTGRFWGMASHCLPMPNLILSNLIEFYGPHSNLRTHSKFPFLSCIQIEYMWEARSISTLTKSNVQMYCIYS